MGQPHRPDKGRALQQHGQAQEQREPRWPNRFGHQAGWYDQSSHGPIGKNEGGSTPRSGDMEVRGLLGSPDPSPNPRRRSKTGGAAEHRAPVTQWLSSWEWITVEDVVSKVRVRPEQRVAGEQGTTQGKKAGLV